MGRNLEEFIKKNFKKAIDNFEIQPFYQPVIRVLSRLDFTLCDIFAVADQIVSEYHMGKMLNLKLVAEGVETAEQVERLRGMGCDYIQGYYYSRPLPQADFEAYLAKE